ncbi:TolC family protein, partial [Metallibacterium scheffleri]|uniref:TolC family protein n=1 Tax=Metallibacterium scheffleri TaxID=993689 RepID=UPI0026EFE7C0
GKQQLDTALAALPRTRPDLLALRAAAQARDAQFRAAVLAQFPGLSVSLSRASDTSRVQSTGVGISLNLPLLGGAQMRARIAGATRDAAYAQYQARLDAAAREARALDVQLRLIAAQRAQLAQRLPQLRELAAHADRAFAAGALNGTTWASVQQNLIARELELINLTANQNKGQVALAALLGRVPPGTAVPSNATAETQQ